MDEVEDKESGDEEFLKLATERFKQAYACHKDDFESIEKVQEFISGEQWPEGIKNEREAHKRPCLTLDHLNQYVRHVVNSGLMRSRDIRVLPMSGEADDEAAAVLAGMIRQISQVSTARYAYETGLRHSCQNGRGYWRAKVTPIPKTRLFEITVRKIPDPRMVLMDPFSEFPDGRDSHYVFVLSKLTQREFKNQYKKAVEEGARSWHTLDSAHTFPWIDEDAVVVAEYYYRDDNDEVKWAVLCPDQVLDRGKHHGDVMPIVRVVGEEFEIRGRQRCRGMINDSSMDAQRAYNYSSSAFIEAVALAPLAPFVAAAGQVEQYETEWKEAHRVPRALLRYDPVGVGGQLVPPPQRSAPAGIPAGWQGMMTNLIGDTQMIMGLAQPSVLGTGGAPVQSGAGIAAQQQPGEVNTYHFHEHWYMAIEQTGRVILAMIPHVYTQAQAVKIVGDDGVMGTAMIDPRLGQATGPRRDAYGKVLSPGYNPSIGRYDVAITTGPSSVTKKQETNKMLMTMVNADPAIMKIAGDLIVGSMDMAGADVLARRMKALLPPGIDGDNDVKIETLSKALMENQELTQQLADMEKILMAEREKAQADIATQQMANDAKMREQQMSSRDELLRQRMDDEAAVAIATLKAQVDLETNTQSNIVKIIVERLKSKTAVSLATIKAFTDSAKLPTHGERMGGYLETVGSLTQGMEPDMITPPPPTSPARPMRRGWDVLRDENGDMARLIPVDLEEEPAPP